MKKAFIIVIVLLIVGVGAARAYQYMAGRDTNRVQEQATAEARTERIETRVSAAGVVEPVRRDLMKAEKADIVAQLFVKVNSEVKSGAGLITFKNRGTIKAPYDGIISRVLVAGGDVVTIGQPLLEIFDHNSFITRIMVDELDLPNIRIGQQAQIAVNAFPNRIYTGKVSDIGQEGKTAGGVSSFPVTITFDDIDQIRAGMTTEGTIVVAAKDEALVIPIEAVSRVGGEKTVLVVNSNGTTETRVVRTGLYSNTMVEIISGLSEGENVRLPQAANDLFQLMPKGFPVQGGQPDHKPGQTEANDVVAVDPEALGETKSDD